jgi:ADP-heptose:LPS heptosyltransferase
VGYDHIFCFETNPTFKPFYTAARDGGHCIDKSRPEANYARRCLDVVARVIGKPLDNYWLNFPVSSDARMKSQDLLAEAGIDDKTFLVGMHPTYSGLKKMPWRRKTDTGRRWPVENFAQLALQLSEHGKKHHIHMRIILDLLPEEADIGNDIVRLSSGKVTLLTPRPDFQRYAATLERMDLLVTPDTGPMHIGGAVGTRLVALFANKDPGDCGAYVPPGHCAFVTSPTRKITDIHPNQVMAACRRFLGH